MNSDLFYDYCEVFGQDLKLPQSQYFSQIPITPRVDPSGVSRELSDYFSTSDALLRKHIQDLKADCPSD